MTTTEIILSELDATKSVTIHCHVDDAQLIHKTDNLIETVSQRGLVVRAKYFGISHARGHQFRTAVSKA